MLMFMSVIFVYLCIKAHNIHLMAHEVEKRLL